MDYRFAVKLLPDFPEASCTNVVQYSQIKEEVCFYRFQRQVIKHTDFFDVTSWASQENAPLPSQTHTMKNRTKNTWRALKINEHLLPAQKNKNLPRPIRHLFRSDFSLATTNKILSLLIKSTKIFFLWKNKLEISIFRKQFTIFVWSLQAVSWCNNQPKNTIVN